MRKTCEGLWLVAGALAFWGSACDEPNPAYLGVPERDGGPGGAANDSGAGQAGAGGGASGGAGGGAASGGSSVDALDPDTIVPDCTPHRCVEQNGEPPCGAWECRQSQCVLVCPNCSDRDLDGFGRGAGCAGQDCDDDDPGVRSEAERGCYEGPVGTEGRGVCKQGVQTCTAGTWGPCTGQVLAGGEACNGEDDDCNGQTDDGLGMLSCGLGACARQVAACTTNNAAAALCLPGAATAQSDGCGNGDEDCDGAIDEDCVDACAWVVAGGSSDPDGTRLAPFGDIQAAIDFVAAGTREGVRQVCVAGGVACGNHQAFRTSDTRPLVMRNRVSVYGNYQTATWARCPSTGAQVTVNTDIELRHPEGIRFDDTVTETTILDGFRLVRQASSATVAAVTVAGGKSVLLSNLHVTDVGSGGTMRSYGVNVTSGGEVTVARSSIWAGRASAEMIGVRALASRVSVLDNCRGSDTRGRCNTSCGDGAFAAVRAYSGLGSSGTPMQAHAVLLDASPASVVARSALCGGQSNQGSAVRIQGAAAGTLVRASFLSQGGAVVDSHGVWLTDCGAAAPRIADNAEIEAIGRESTTRTAGIFSEGDCHPVIDNNLLIAGAQEGQASGTHGVLCAARGGKASRCSILSNADIRGSRAGASTVAIGVRCVDGACGRIDRNLISGGQGRVVQGMRIQKAGPVVSRNQIFAGCAEGPSHGVLAEDAYARLENNRVFGSTCEGAGVPGQSVALQTIAAARAINELDVHSNLLDGLSRPVGCTSYGVLIGAPGVATSAPNGIFRNNIVLAGNCQLRSGVREAGPTFDPRIFEHNDLVPVQGGALYVDEETTILSTLDGVNALADAQVSGNISAPPGFVQYRVDLRLRAGSMCINAGTREGAPAGDASGLARDDQPDIGPYEYVPAMRLD